MPVNGTREQRFSDPLKIREEMPKLAGKKINIVLTDSRVIMGELKAVKHDEIIIENMRLKKVQLSFPEISEIYFDTIV